MPAFALLLCVQDSNLAVSGPRILANVYYVQCGFGKKTKFQ
jgi:hypothetical protein